MARPLNREIIAALRSRILSGSYDHSEFLPSERSLAEELEVGRGTVRIALRMLQQEGILRMVPRRGVCVVREAKPPRLERILVRCPGMLSRNAYELLGMLSAICVAASERFAEALLSFTPAPPAPQELEERYRKGDIQGMISIEDPDCLAGLKERGVPAVVVNLEKPQDQVHCRVDFRGVGRLAGMRLLAAGHRRIGVLSGDLSSFIYREMLAGFRGALAEEEIYPEAGMVIEAPLNRTERAYGSLADLLRSSERPTAFFATRDHRAEMIWRACRELNLRIPEDLSVIGYDDISWPSAESQGLTTIRQPLDEMGHIALELLDEYFRTGIPPVSRTVSPSLIERSSVAG